MQLYSDSPRRNQRAIGRSLLLLLAVAAFMSGCATSRKATFSSAVEGTQVIVNGASLGTVGRAGATFELPEQKDKKANVTVLYEANEYFPETTQLTPAQLSTSPLTVPQVNLVRRQVTKRVRINSSPEDVTVLLDGRPIGKTDFTTDLTFRRARKEDRFAPLTLSFQKTDYQEEKLVLEEGQYSSQSVIDLPSVKLERLKDVKKYTLTALAQRRDTGRYEPVSVDISVDGKPAGKTGVNGYSWEVTFLRADKSQPWPVHKVAVTLADQFKTIEQRIVYDSPSTFRLELEPVTEFMVDQFTPMVEVPPTGATYTVRTRKTLGMRDATESAESPTINLTPVTGYRRPESVSGGRAESINSFTATPDGEHVIYSLSTRLPNGSYYSNLYLKGISDIGSPVSQLTSSERYHYTNPRFGQDGSRVLVFQGNAENINKPDIYKTELDSNYAITSGITRLTMGSMLCSTPSFRDSSDRVYYVSLEPEFAQAKPRLGTIRFDGTLQTILGIDGEDPRPAGGTDGAVYFTKRDPVTSKLQIFKAISGARQETRIIQDPNFQEANCFDPDLDAKGERLLFVSDKSSKSAENPEHNIYMIDLREGVSKSPLQITFNRSMDFSPRWIPSAQTAFPNRMFFLSTRGGATNIWYLDIQAK